MYSWLGVSSLEDGNMYACPSYGGCGTSAAGEGRLVDDTHEHAAEATRLMAAGFKRHPDARSGHYWLTPDGELVVRQEDAILLLEGLSKMYRRLARGSAS